MSKKKRLSVADFFCGAGGFSEGFRQAGFKVAFALDNWKPAIDTHELNHPNCKHALMNILELNTPKKIDEVIPDTDVIIGSPPCVAFSGSNRAGKADKSLGIQLIESYLRIIAWKKKKGVLKHWILENVPGSKNYIKDKYTWKELGLPGKGPTLTMQERHILNAAEYGAPQGRKRFVCGDYPCPKKTNNSNNFLTVRKVLNNLGNPSQLKKGKIKDPNYKFSINSSELTDHYYDARVDEFEWKRSKQLKEDHGFMGKMSFPESLDRPSRTVMATRSASTRESMIFDSFDKNGKHNGYRLPTIREIATFMSFPITYQFQGNTESVKYRLVGNAVCSKLGFELAKNIAISEKVSVPANFLNLNNSKAKVNLNGSKRRIKKHKPLKFESRFVLHVPYLKINTFRVELNNTDSDLKNKKVRWNCYLHQGSGDNRFRGKVNQSIVTNLLKNSEKFSLLKKKSQKLNSKLSATELQLEYIKRTGMGPSLKLKEMKNIVDEVFPESIFTKKTVDNSNKSIPIKREEIPIRIVAALYLCNEFVNNLS